MSPSPGRLLATLAAVSVLVAACGDDDDTAAAGDERATVVVTTNILGDVVEQLSGGAVDVVTLMPVGADPHDFQLSARQVAEIQEADLLIVNGGGFEAGLVDVIDSATADGVPTFEALSAVDTLEFDEHADEEHADEGDHADQHSHDGADPHFFTDPARMAAAARAIADELVEHAAAADVDAIEAAADAYVAELEALATDVGDILAPIADSDRVLVTNHEVFGYFADAYGFEIIGTVIPSGSTADGASAADLTALEHTIEDVGVPAVFTDTSATAGLVDTLAAEVGDIDVVELFTESLGDADSDGATYLDMIRTNAERIAAALS